MEIQRGLHLPIVFIIKNLSNSSIAETPKAFKNVWFLGDEFLHAVFATFQQMKTDALDRQRPMPYMYDYYNVKMVMAQRSNVIKSTIAKIFNALVEALNEEKLPYKGLRWFK